MCAMTQHAEKLAKLADRYRAATEDLRQARLALAAEIRAAAGDMKQADIIRATGHVWTREQVRRVLADESGPGK